MVWLVWIGLVTQMCIFLGAEGISTYRIGVYGDWRAAEQRIVSDLRRSKRDTGCYYEAKVYVYNNNNNDQAGAWNFNLFL